MVNMKLSRKMTVNRQLNDSIMMIIHCSDSDSYVLSRYSCGWSLPYVFCSEGSWRHCALSLYESIMGKVPFVTFEMSRIYRIWRGDNKTPLQNVVFCARVNGVGPKKSENSDAFQHEAVNYESIQALVEKKELTPEVSNFLELIWPEAELKAPSTSKFHKSSSNLIEIVKNDILTPTEDSGRLNTLINSLQLSDEDELVLYEMYLNCTFPYLMMDESGMLTFMRKLALKTFTSDHFRAADIYNRACIDFKQLLGFISAINPQYSADTVIIDQRCRYVFRYYDKDRDDRLTVAEFSKMVDDIAATQKHINDKKLLVHGLKDGYISILDFIKLVKSSKLLGTSALMCATTSVQMRIDEIKKKNIKSREYEEQLREKTMNPPSSPTYSLAGHVVGLTSEGEINSSDIRKIQTAFKSDGRNPRTDNLIPTSSSIETFSTQTCAVYVLRVLKFFSDDFTNLVEAPTNWWEEKFSEYQSQLIQCCQQVQRVLEEESRLLRIDSPVYIIGDIHGNYQTIMAFEKWFWSVGLECSPGSVLFLGDYVDRGLNSVEVIGYLMAQKLKNPKKIFLLRGNHEIRKVQKEFSFFSECETKFERGGTDFWNAVNEVFDRLPLAALIDNQIFCCHGGIPMPSTCETLSAIDAICCPLPEPSESKLAWSLLWNDPQKVGYNYIQGKKILEGGFSKNTRRKTGHTFDSMALQSFIDKHKLSYVVRAHEVQEEGFQVDLNNKLITVFSSSYYKGNNKAGCVLVQQNKLRMFTMFPPS